MRCSRPFPIDDERGASKNTLLPLRLFLDLYQLCLILICIIVTEEVVLLGE